MAQQQQQTAPAHPDKLSPRVDHIHAICYVENLRNLDALKQLETEIGHVLHENERYSKAFFDAQISLRIEAINNRRLAKADGHLLMCWEGSTLPAAHAQASGLAS